MPQSPKPLLGTLRWWFCSVWAALRLRPGPGELLLLGVLQHAVDEISRANKRLEAMKATSTPEDQHPVD